MIRILVGDWIERLRQLPDGSVDCCVTSPPYWGLRDYDMSGQVGTEPTLPEYVAQIVGGLSELRRVLTPTGTVWLNVGDAYTGSGRGLWKDSEARRRAKIKESYRPQTGDGLTRTSVSGLKRKQLMGIPWRIALALQDDGWWWRGEIVWHKPNAKPENVPDRPGRDHEIVLMLTTSDRYYYNKDAVRENGGTRNARTVWSINTRASWFGHTAVFPVELPRRCIMASCPPGGVVIDPFAGEGTTLYAAHQLGLDSVGIELNPTYAAQSADKLRSMGCSVA